MRFFAYMGSFQGSHVHKKAHNNITTGQTGGCRPVPDMCAVFTDEGAVVEFGTRGIPVMSPICMIGKSSSLLDNMLMVDAVAVDTADMADIAKGQ